MPEAARRPNPIMHVVRPGPDGLQEHVVALTSGLAQYGCVPFVVGPLERGFREELTRNDVRWVNLPLPTTAARRERREAAAHLSRLLEAAAPALVHAHGFQAALTSVPALHDLQPRPPLVWSPHGIPSHRGRRRFERILRRLAYRRVLRCSDAVIAGTDAERDSLSHFNVSGDAADRIRVVPAGVRRRGSSVVFDVGEKRRRVGLHQDAAIVITAAPFEDGTALADLLHAAALVSEDVANVEFAIVGEGEGLEELKALAHELRLSGSVVFLGKRADAADIIATCNVVVALSGDAWAADQALGALAGGLRVVADDCPSLREIFGGVEGVPVAPVGDHRAFADAILQQLEGLTIDEEEIGAITGMAWGLSEVLASQDEFDLDEPGLDPRDRSKDAGSEVDQLLDRHSVAHMTARTLELYSQIIGGESP